MKNLVFSFLLLSCRFLIGQSYTISGYLQDIKNGESIIGAAIYDKDNPSTGGVSNIYGFYSISLPAGKHTIVYESIGFSATEKEIDLQSDLSLNIELIESAIKLAEVNITEDIPDKNTQSTKMSTIELKAKKMKELPALMGEVDILKTIQLLPGVQSSGEGNAGFYVRGGGPDQNLILLDEAVVYNAAHLFGFFSVFNADAVKDVEIIKGGMPAQYGGRLSSVLNISMNEGNSKKYQVDGGIGLISSRLTVQGPIKKDTSSFIISGRRTYIDILMRPFLKNNESFSGTGYYFYDLNTKWNYKFSNKDRLYLSGYFGKDVFDFGSALSDFNISIPWGNATGSLRWNHLFSDKLFMNTSLVYSDYNFAFDAGNEDFRFKLFSGITDYTAKSDFSYFGKKHNLKWGLNAIYHVFVPNNLEAEAGGIEFGSGEVLTQQGIEGGVYFQDDWEINSRWSVNYGLRYSWYDNRGPFKRFEKNEIGITIDTISYGNFEHINFHNGLEPRASVKYGINENTSLKGSFTRNYQYVHMATLTGNSLPTDVWVPSSEVVKPQEATQYAIGYFQNFLDNKFESSVEVYYKDMNNLIEFAEGAQPQDGVNDNTDNSFVFGDGWSYGAEFFIKKRTGDLTGWIGYTWSKTERLFPDINQGKVYPVIYDRRHDLSVVLSYAINDRMTLAGTFIYATGNAITVPLGLYVIDGTLVRQQSERNSFRIKPYHRADISLTIKGKESKKFKSSWNFSIYNLYNRQNVYFYNFTSEGSIINLPMTGATEQVSLFPILPSVTWNFNF